MEEGKTRLLVDLGGDPAHLASITFEPRDLQGLRALIITHAHFDHYGGIFDFFLEASAMKYLPAIFCTETTKQFLLQFGYKEWLQFGTGSHSLDAAGQRDFFKALQQKIATLSYGQTYRLGDIEILLLPSSHILGSIQVYIRSSFAEGLITSDFKPSGTTLLRAFDVQYISETFNVNLKPDFIVIESTYGKNAIERDAGAVESQIVNSIREVFENGGNLLVPCFAIGRAQEFMTYYYRLLNQHACITPLNVYFIGATSKATKIYVDSAKTRQGDAIALHDDAKSRLEWVNLPSIRDFESHFKKIGARGDLRQKVSLVKENGFNVFITSGGMLQGPALELFMELKDDPRNALFLIGYQANGTSGHALAEAADSPDARKNLLFDGRQLSIDQSEAHAISRLGNSNRKYQALDFRFKVLQFSIFSAHATFTEKMGYLADFSRITNDKRIRVFSTHGIEGNCIELAKEVETIGFNGTAPSTNETFTI